MPRFLSVTLFLWVFLLRWFQNAVKCEDIFQPDDDVNSTEQILLRQETQLGSVVDLLTQIRDLFNSNTINNTLITYPNVTENPPQELQCKTKFSPVNGVCLHVDFTIREEGLQQAGLSWTAASRYCTGLGADLAAFADANAYVDALNFIHRTNDGKDITMDIWIGGSDEANEGTWLWKNGNHMPRGTPFWGTQRHDNVFHQEPSGGGRQNCAMLWYKNKYFIHDSECEDKAAPLCQHE
ncbi:unnamed protein product [Meganyctiphanes norvegica]|uniref:C-type lectin domain-containing protein n=1 Tax=Meganyctiphanes norvegica TaxID=48144 RepID=A0AAV2QF63_MEGNR